MKKRILSAVVWLCAVGSAGLAFAAEGPAYHFAPGAPVIYEITITTEVTDSTRKDVNYVQLEAKEPADAQGETKMGYLAAHSNNGSLPEFLRKNGKTDRNKGNDFTIGANGNFTTEQPDSNDLQLPSAMGLAYHLVIQPLPSDNQKTWKTHRAITLYSESQKPRQGGFGGGPFGASQDVTRVEKPAEENVSYSADEVHNGKLTVKRHYELATVEQVGTTPAEQIIGDGTYTFDVKTGQLASFDSKLLDKVTSKNVTMKIPITVSLRAITPDVLADLQAKQTEVIAKRDADRAKRDAERRNDTDKLPDGMEKTELLGDEHNREFMKIDPDRRPLAGLKFATEKDGDKISFNMIEPLYEKPGELKKNETAVLAKDGYAVGSITVNTTDHVNAFCITFMKKTTTGVDRTAKYTSPWYGVPQGTTRKVLTGDGRFVFGIAGRKFWRIDAIGLVVEAAPGDASEKK